MASLQAKGDGRKAKGVIRKVQMKSLDKHALLVDFLSEALTLSDMHNEVYSEVTFSEFSETTLAGELHGFPVEGFDEDIKAVTHHGLEIKKVAGGYEVVVLFDI